MQSSHNLSHFFHNSAHLDHEYFLCESAGPKLKAVTFSFELSL